MVQTCYDKKRLTDYRVLKILLSSVSNIRHTDFRPSWFFLCPSSRPAGWLSRSRDRPWFPKQVGLESSGRRLISSNGKTNRIAFFSVKKKHYNIFLFCFLVVYFVCKQIPVLIIKVKFLIVQRFYGKQKVNKLQVIVIGKPIPSVLCRCFQITEGQLGHWLLDNSCYREFLLAVEQIKKNGF